jgi:hypothetical protein
LSASYDRVAVAFHSINPGEIGELCAQGGNFMDCYWNRPEETESAFRGGWYHSGDAGYLDKQQYLFLVDRVKDMIVTGGETSKSSRRPRRFASPLSRTDMTREAEMPALYIVVSMRRRCPPTTSDTSPAPAA